MSTNSLVVGGWHATTDYFKNGSIFIGIGQTTRGGVLATEANVQRKALVAHTLTSLGCMVTSSSTGANTTALKSRVAGANGNLSVTLGGSVTGWQQDTTHSDSITSGTLINIAFVGTSAVPDCFITEHAVTVQASSPLSFLTWSSLQSDDTNSYSLSGSTNTFTQLSGGTAAVGAGETTESATSKITIRGAGTAKGLAAVLTTNTTGSSIAFHNNGSTGNQTISPGTTAVAALTQDTTHTDALVSGDAADYVFNAASHTMNTIFVGVEVVGTTSGQDVVTSEQSSTTSIGTSDVFMGVGNSWGTNATETQSQTKVPYAATSSRMRVHITTNSRSVSMTMTGRVGAADGNQTITISSSTTGVLEDTTHSDSLSSGALINYKIASTGGTGSAIYNWAALKLDDGSSTGSSTETGTISQAFGGIAQSAVGGRQEPGTITMSFGGIHQTIAGNVIHATGSISQAFGGITQHVIGFVAEEYGTVIQHFGGISQVVAGSDLSKLPALRQFWTFGN